MSGGVEMILNEIKKHFQKNNNVESIILFGSVARGTSTRKSDVDLCFILKKKTKQTENRIFQKLLDIGKKYDKDIQAVFTTKTFPRMNRQFLETLYIEGRTLKGKLPPVSLKRLSLEPWIVIKYNLSKLNQYEKMKVKRLLYGNVSTRKYKGKIYVNKNKGLVDETGSLRTGKASILIPAQKVHQIEKELRKMKVKLRKIPAWLQKV
jgi:predicted nucleotidyltransferase